MKKILILFLFFISLCSIGQEKQQTYSIRNKANHIYDYQSKRTFFVPNPENLILINITNNRLEQNNGWAISGTTCRGCASFFYKILRTKNTIVAENKLEYFYFYFYFYSNSFLPNGSPAATYLRDVNFYLNGKFVFNVPYILLEPGQVIYAAWARSGNPNSKVSFETTKVSVH